MSNPAVSTGIVSAGPAPTAPTRSAAAETSGLVLPVPESSSAAPQQPSSAAPPASSAAPPESSAPAPTSDAPAPESSSPTAQPSSEALPTTSAAPPSITSEAAPTTREQPTSTVVETSTAATPSSTSVADAVIASTSETPGTVTGTRTVPGLISKTTSAARPSGSLDSANSSSSSTSLSGGAIAGIVIGVIAGVVILGLIATRFLMQRKRASRNANRASMFEPWQTAPATEEPFEKSYPMEPQPSFPNTGGDQFADPNAAFYGNQYNAGGAYPDAYGNYPAAGGYPGAEQYAGAGAAGAGAGMVGAGAYGAAQAQQPYDAGAQQVSPVSPSAADAPVNFAAPPADAAAAPGAGAGAGAGAAAAGVAAGAAVGAGGAAAAAGAGTAHTASPEAAAAGLHDGMMARVKVGFVRSLEDELAITQGQQLYMHTSYDDGWCLCEDDQHNRGVVPISCLEPWTQ